MLMQCILRLATITVWFVAALSLPIPQDDEDESLLVAAAPAEQQHEKDARDYQTNPSLIIKPFGQEQNGRPSTQKVPPKTKPKTPPPSKTKPVQKKPPNPSSTKSPSPAADAKLLNKIPIRLPWRPSIPNIPGILYPPTPKPPTEPPKRPTNSPGKPNVDPLSLLFPTPSKSKLPPSILRSLTAPNLLGPHLDSKPIRLSPSDPLPKIVHTLNEHMINSPHDPIPLEGTLVLPPHGEYEIEINRCNTEVPGGNDQVGSIPCGSVYPDRDVELSIQTPFDRFLLKHMVSVKDCRLASECYQNCPVEIWHDQCMIFCANHFQCSPDTPGSPFPGSPIDPSW